MSLSKSLKINDIKTERENTALYFKICCFIFAVNAQNPLGETKQVLQKLLIAPKLYQPIKNYCSTSWFLLQLLQLHLFMFHILSVFPTSFSHSLTATSNNSDKKLCIFIPNTMPGLVPLSQFQPMPQLTHYICGIFQKIL